MKWSAWKTMSLLGLSAAVAVASGAMTTAPPAMGQQDDADKKKAEVGKAAPDFTLEDLEGKEHKLSDLKGKVVVIEWFNPECPYVVRHYRNGTSQKLAKEMKERDVVWLAINSGAPGKQGAGLEKNKGYQKNWEIEFPILLDESGKVGKMYDARTTPHMFVINKEGVLVYHGAMDNAPRGTPSDGELMNYVKNAVKQVLAGETVTPDHVRPYGCRVHY